MKEGRTMKEGRCPNIPTDRTVYTEISLLSIKKHVVLNISNGGRTKKEEEDTKKERKEGR
jgi:hypothetical protein